MEKNHETLSLMFFNKKKMTLKHNQCLCSNQLKPKIKIIFLQSTVKFLHCLQMYTYLFFPKLWTGSPGIFIYCFANIVTAVADPGFG